MRKKRETAAVKVLSASKRNALCLLLEVAVIFECIVKFIDIDFCSFYGVRVSVHLDKNIFYVCRKQYSLWKQCNVNIRLYASCFLTARPRRPSASAWEWTPTSSCWTTSASVTPRSLCSVKTSPTGWGFHSTTWEWVSLWKWWKYVYSHGISSTLLIKV